MKNALMVIGLVVVLFVGVVIAGIVFFGSKGAALYKESQAYVDAAIPAIVSEWDKGELIDRASPEFLARVDDKELDRRFRMYKTLGQLKEYKRSERKAEGGSFKWSSKEDREIVVKYEAWGEFDAGDAKIKISVIKHGDDWQISDFGVYSTAFPDLL